MQTGKVVKKLLYAHSIIYDFEKFYTIMVLLSVIMFNSIITVYIICHIKDKKNRVILTILNLIILVYQTSHFLFIVSTPRELNLLIIINNSCYCLLGPFFFIYLSEGIRKQFMSGYEYMKIFIVPFIAIIILLTNNFHQLFFSTINTFYINYNLIFKVITVFNNICLIYGSILLIRYLCRNNDKQFKFILFYITGLFFMISVNIYDAFSPAKFSNYLLTPVCIIIVQLMFLMTARTAGKFKITFNFEKKILDSIDESLIITDISNNILYYNNSHFNEMVEAGISRSIHRVLNNINKNTGSETNIEKLADTLETTGGEFRLNYPERKYYSYRVYPLKSGNNYVAGKIYTFKNISRYKSLINILNRKNKELTEKYNMLKRHNDIIRQLIQEKERQRIISRVSNTVGDYLLRIIKLLNKDFINTTNDFKDIKEKLRVSIELARSGIRNIRGSVSTLKELEKAEGGGFVDKSNYRR